MLCRDLEFTSKGKITQVALELQLVVCYNWQDPIQGIYDNATLGGGGSMVESTTVTHSSVDLSVYT